MKKMLFLLSVLTLMSYGCNRNEEKASETGMQREESLNRDTPGTYEDSESVDIQREEYRNNDSDVTTPIDDRPNLEEEE